MDYHFYSIDCSIENTILKMNSLRKEDLDISKVSFTCDNRYLKEFVDALKIHQKDKFLIVGDYDCDGICATAIMKRLFDYLKIQNNFYIPSRSKEGYGINASIIQKAIDYHFDCLLLVDNGVVANKELQLAKEHGITSFVIDHHEYLNPPDCDYLLHPNQFHKPYMDMCAGGLCSLLASQFYQDDLSTAYGGLATLADMVSVLGYNRFLLKSMLEILKKNKIAPISLLLENNEVSYTNLSYHVIPKINAISRLEEYCNVNHMVEYLLAKKESCVQFYDKIASINKMRKELTSQMEKECKNSLNPNEKCILLYSDTYKEGLCGLLANRILHEYHKPVLVLASHDGMLKGSGRSLDGFNFYDYLKDFGFFESYGGHAQALGLSIKEENISKLKEYIENKKMIVGDFCENVLKMNVADLNFKNYNEISSLEPYGTGLLRPRIYVENVLYQKKDILKNQYPKFQINEQLEAISFHLKHKDMSLNNMIGSLSINSFHKNKLSFLIDEFL